MALVGATFWFYSRQPLHHTDLWGHLAYGRLIWQSRALPAHEPFMPLSEAAPFVDTAWLTQVVGFLAISIGGPAAIQFLHAAGIAACCGILVFDFYFRTRNALLSTAGVVLFTALNWFQFQVVRPQMAGLACCVILLVMLGARRWKPFLWVAIPLTIALWANLHGSFAVGLGLLICACLGRIIDVWRRTKHLATPLRDFHARRLLVVTALSTASALLNPYGLQLYAEVLSFSRHPNLADLTEWHRLALHSHQGELAVATGLALAVLYWLSPRRVPVGEAMALVSLGVATLLSARMIIWWTPIAAGCCVIQAQAVWHRFFPSWKRKTPSPRSQIWILVAAGLAIVVFVLAPRGLPMIVGRPVDVGQSVSDQTPVAAVNWLREHPPAGQVFNTYEWGDYLVWAGPASVQIFVTSQAHLVRRNVWLDYMAVINVAPGWKQILDNYDVVTVLADKRHRGALIGRLRKEGHWRLDYQDDISAIFTRRP